ncbi:hypothetical protein EC900039_0868B, partial [Escherichia coli 90.0039]
DAESMMSAIFH